MLPRRRLLLILFSGELLHKLEVRCRGARVNNWLELLVLQLMELDLRATGALLVEHCVLLLLRLTSVSLVACTTTALFLPERTKVLEF